MRIYRFAALLLACTMLFGHSMTWAGGPGDDANPTPVAPATVAAEAVPAAPATEAAAPAAPATLQQAQQLYRKGAIDKALQLVRSHLQKNPADVDALLLEGALYRKKRDHRRAARTYERVLKADPENALVRNLQSLIHLQLSRETDDAVESARLLGKSVEYGGNEPFLLLEYIGKLCKTDDAAEAVRAYESLPKGYDVPLSLTLGVADAARREQLYDNAERFYLIAQKADPGNAKAPLGLVTTLIAAGDHTRALETVDQALETFPGDLALMEVKGSVEQALHRRYAAIQTYERMLEIAPIHTTAASEKARILAEIGCASLATEMVNANPDRIRPDVREFVNEVATQAAARREQARPVDGGDAPDLIVICYNDVTSELTDQPLEVQVEAFVEQIEYLRADGFTFVDADAVLASTKRQEPLPRKSVMLTFDGGYASFQANVMPILDLYGYPAMVSVNTSWLDGRPHQEVKAALMTWEQVRAVTSNDLFTVASFGHELYGYVPRDPQGNRGAAGNTRAYYTDGSGYESEAEFRERIAADLSLTREIIKTRVGSEPRYLAWPLGAFNRPALEEAARAGFELSFGYADSYASGDSLIGMKRWVVAGNPSLAQFGLELAALSGTTPVEQEQIRGVALDLDIIADESPAIQAENIEQALTRIQELAVNTVFVQGYFDPDSDGNAEEVYFPNRVLPVRADLLSHTVESLKRLGLTVYVSMPALSFTLPDRMLTSRLQVLEIGGGTVISSTSWSKRLSPFGKKSAELVGDLFEDLGAYVNCDGVVFGVDAFLTDKEDFNPAALRRFADEFNLERFDLDALTHAQKVEWMHLKTRQLTLFTKVLMSAVRGYRPSSRFARRLYAPALHLEASERWLAQSYAEALETYDHVVIIADPETEEITRPIPWLGRLVTLAGEHENGLARTIFELSAYNPRRARRIRERELQMRIAQLVESGAHHIVYCEDDYRVDRPRLVDMRDSIASPERTLLSEGAMAE